MRHIDYIKATIYHDKQFLFNSNIKNWLQSMHFANYHEVQNKNVTLSHYCPSGNMISTPSLLYSSKKLEHMNCIVEQDQTIGGLYIGDVISTIIPGILQSGSIGAILACSYEETHFKYKARTDYKAQLKIIDTHDSLSYPIKMHFNSSYEFIQQCRNKKLNVLIHCHAGVSRSATILIAYLMKKNNWTADKAYNIIKNKRERIKPNQNFWKQLLEYENQLGDDNTNTDKPLSSIKNIRQKNFDTSYSHTVTINNQFKPNSNTNIKSPANQSELQNKYRSPHKMSNSNFKPMPVYFQQFNNNYNHSPLVFGQSSNIIIRHQSNSKIHNDINEQKSLNTSRTYQINKQRANNKSGIIVAGNTCKKVDKPPLYKFNYNQKSII